MKRSSKQRCDKAVAKFITSELDARISFHFHPGFNTDAFQVEQQLFRVANVTQVTKQSLFRA